MKPGDCRISEKKVNHFTLIELMVVLSIIGILVALISPALSKSRMRAKYSRWLGYTNNLRSDPTLIGQWIFPDSMSDIVLNNAQGISEDGYNSKDYNGKLYNVGVSKNGGRFSKSAAYFYGAANSYILVDDNTRFYSQGKNMTVIVWFKVSDYNQRILVAKGNSRRRVPGWSIFLRGRRVIFRYSSDKTQGVIAKVKSEIKYPLNKWSMAAFVIDNTNRKLTGFLNGTVASADLRTPRRDNEPSFDIEPMYIGRRRASGRYYKGFIDELEIFRRAMRVSELEGAYEMGQE
jgi:prepilin-type N-terminal cleavage/methylation domain-containing protein